MIIMHPDKVTSAVNLGDASCKSSIGRFIVRVV